MSNKTPFSNRGKCEIVEKDVRVEGVRVSLPNSTVSQIVRRRCDALSSGDPLCPMAQDSDQEAPVGCLFRSA